ncbi:MAG: phosphoribosylaminoimidazolecarboxamide formyltransferase / cyclohydrolase [Actinomycetota bacterium]|jgi:phosphoribosylaminoimidazolecarboxamide formyltransferase/IMP cyclohydrolase|nr:phosphoribosylaminoimidazolecarboxamide formyltransferase / cyclohydrolase [Actinomycetota bacterium]
MRALLSVYDKAGLLDLARGLSELGWELVSSGGTARSLTEAGIACTEVAEVTGAPEMLGGRVKTLHPSIAGGILADRSKPEHLADLEGRGIVPIDLVVCNLYPFREEPSVEMIDVGGPTMVRAAAKNHASVGVVVDPSDYSGVLEELRVHGTLSDGTRRGLARAAFAATAAYDAAIAAWFDFDDNDPLPTLLNLSLQLAEHLRYGENPHQKAARYRTVGGSGWWDGVVQHGGMALSYLNLCDAEAAWQLVHDLGEVGDRPAVAIIKHANPCGAAVADDLATAYRLAFEGDPTSAFGGIVALNRPVDEATVAAMEQGAQADVVIAPSYEPGTLERLAAKRKNTRLLTAPPPTTDSLHLRAFAGGFLAQEPNRFVADRSTWRVVSEAQPTEEQWTDAELAWRLCGHTKSNAVVLVNRGQAVGIGAGQQSRVDAAEVALRKAGDRAKGGASATDGFYPFPDGVEVAAASGVAVVVQPGGSIRDGEAVAAADAHGLAMVITGERQFRH